MFNQKRWLLSYLQQVDSLDIMFPGKRYNSSFDAWKDVNSFYCVPAQSLQNKGFSAKGK